MRNHVFFIILTSLSKIFTCCHLISHNKFSQVSCAWHALQNSHTWKGFLGCSRGGYRWRRVKYPDLNCAGAVQKSVENDRSHPGCAASSSICIVNSHQGHMAPIRLTLFWPQVPKNASHWKSMSAGERGHLPSVHLSTCLEVHPFLSSHTVAVLISLFPFKEISCLFVKVSS